MDDVEALACRRAIEFAMEKGLQQVIFKGDSATVLNCIQAGSPCLAPFGNAIEDSISLASQFAPQPLLVLPCSTKGQCYG